MRMRLGSCGAAALFLLSLDASCASHPTPPAVAEGATAPSDVALFTSADADAAGIDWIGNRATDAIACMGFCRAMYAAYASTPAEDAIAFRCELQLEARAPAVFCHGTAPGSDLHHESSARHE